jgi:membrane protease YdiL (CAAX protease family)
MNENLSAISGQGAAEAPKVASELLPRPWGFWSTLCWAVFALGLGIAIVSGGVLWLSGGHPDNVPDGQEDPWLPLHLIVVNLVQIAVLALAARLARWPVGQYLGLVRPRRHDVMAGIAALAALIGALEILTRVLGQDSVTPFQADAYRAAQAAGLLPLLWLAFVIAAPAGEEILFRGFLFRGWAASPLGGPGTILLTSCIFAALHTQYDSFGVFQTFCISTLFGWSRWRSGSTLLTIALHVIINFVSTLWSAVKAVGLV